MSTLNVSNITDGTDTVETGYVVNGSAKAWVNFNGTGTIAISDSFNVSSLTDLGTGYYAVNLTNSFSSADYSTTMGGNNFHTASVSSGAGVIQMFKYDAGHANVDASRVYSTAHGDLA